MDAWNHLYSNCGCSSKPWVCRDLDLVLMPNGNYQATCKKTSTDDCENSVEELAEMWMKVPADLDKYCNDLYNRTQFMKSSCN